MMQDVPAAFFSYCREDSDSTLRLAGDLKAADANMWLDQLDIIPGQRWDRAVEGALASCQRMLVILTPAAVNSTNVMDEVSFALEEWQTVIPVIYKCCSVPCRLCRVQHVDFRQDYARGLKELLKTLAPKQKAVQGAPAISEIPSRGQEDIAEADRLEHGAEDECLGAAEDGKQAVERERLDPEHKLAAEQAQLENKPQQTAERAGLEEEPKRAGEQPGWSKTANRLPNRSGWGRNAGRRRSRQGEERRQKLEFEGQSRCR